MLRRIRLAVTAVILLVAGTAVTAVAARDAYYVDRPLPGVVVREASLAEPVTVVVEGRRVAVQPGRVLRIYRSATARVDPGGRPALLPDESPGAGGSRARRRSRSTRCSSFGPARWTGSRTSSRRSCRSRRRRRSSCTASSPTSCPPGGARASTGAPSCGPARGGPRRPARRRGELEDVAVELDTAAAEEAAETARLVVSAPVRCASRDRGVGELSREQLARLAPVHAAARPLRRHVRPGAPRSRRAAVGRPVAPPGAERALRRRGHAASGSSRRAPGLDVNPKRALAAVTAAAYSPTRTATLTMRETRADRTTRDAEALGIRERISTFTTEMGVRRRTGSTTSS